MTAAALGSNPSSLSPATGGTGPGSHPLDDVDGAWESAQRAAEFAALIAVGCEREGHGAEPCQVRAVAEDGARQSLAVAQEMLVPQVRGAVAS